MLHRVKYVTSYFFEKQKYKIKAIKVVLELFKLAKQSCNMKKTPVNFLQILLFVKVI